MGFCIQQRVSVSFDPHGTGTDRQHIPQDKQNPHSPVTHKLYFICLLTFAHIPKGHHRGRQCKEKCEPINPATGPVGKLINFAPLSLLFSWLLFRPNSQLTLCAQPLCHHSRFGAESTECVYLQKASLWGLWCSCGHYPSVGQRRRNCPCRSCASYPGGAVLAPCQCSCSYVVTLNNAFPYIRHPMILKHLKLNYSYKSYFETDGHLAFHDMATPCTPSFYAIPS